MQYTEPLLVEWWRKHLVYKITIILKSTFKSWKLNEPIKCSTIFRNPLIIYFTMMYSRTRVFNLKSLIRLLLLVKRSNEIIILFCVALAEEDRLHMGNVYYCKKRKVEIYLSVSVDLIVPFKINRFLCWNCIILQIEKLIAWWLSDLKLFIFGILFIWYF